VQYVCAVYMCSIYVQYVCAVCMCSMYVQYICAVCMCSMYVRLVNYLHQFICVLLNDALTGSDSVASNDTMIDK
jgi:hypothetical protein